MIWLMTGCGLEISRPNRQAQGADQMKEIGNEHWINGNLDGLQGNPPVSQHPDYLDGCQRGMQTAEDMHIIKQGEERKYESF